MAAVTITEVQPTASTQTQLLPFGATIAVGKLVYVDTVTKNCKLCDCDVSQAATSVRGIAMTSEVNGGYGIVAFAGRVKLAGATMVVTDSYYVGDAPGALVPDADLATGDWIAKVGRAVTSTELELDISWYGLQHP